MSKQKQMRRVFCHAMIIEFIELKPLTVENVRVAGFGDGRFNSNRINFQPSLGMGRKDEKILKNIAVDLAIIMKAGMDGFCGIQV
jgi:hypothetical protein